MRLCSCIGFSSTFAAKGIQWVDWPRHRGSTGEKAELRAVVVIVGENVMREGTVNFDPQTAAEQQCWNSCKGQIENPLLRIRFESEISCSAAPVVSHAFTNKRTTQLTARIRRLDASSARRKLSDGKVQGSERP